MATINIKLEENNSPFNTTLRDINYIPSYKEAETERRTNETNRIANENSREEYINDFKDRVSNGDFNGKDGAIQYEAGNGIKIENNVISATGGEAVWGSITGTLSNQTDLKGILDNKANASDIPTKVSELSNDTNFITKTVDNLINYYKKSEIYTQDQVNTLISNVNSFNVEVVQILPTENIDVHTIYLVPKKAEANDNYDEYIYINSSWEHIGSTSVDLTNYYNKNEVDTKLEQKQDALVSAENIKTINNNEILGTGNIDINTFVIGDTPPTNPKAGELWLDTNDTEHLTEIDNEVSTISNNAVSNSAITNYVNSTNNKIDNLINYSEEETSVGKWLNGKTIYRKIVTTTINNTYTENNYSYTFINGIVNNMEELISIKVLSKQTNNDFVTSDSIMITPSIKSDYRFQCGFITTLFENGTPMKIIIEYTKSTATQELNEESEN